MKKARKIIPALAMLLVSAIMMSTASFAWFTMNEKVTATGMQVQAKSTGSLVISDQPLTYQSTKTEVDFASAAKQLAPIHLATVADAGAWQLPQSPEKINPVTGKLDESDSLVTTDISTQTANYFFDKVVYIGSAGWNCN